MTRKSMLLLTTLGLFVGLCIVSSVFAQSEKPPADQPEGQDLPGVITLQCDSSTKCVGKADYKLKYELALGNAAPKPVEVTGSWSCRQVHEIKNLPVDTKASLVVDWRTSKQGVTGQKKLSIQISSNPKKNHFVISK